MTTVSAYGQAICRSFIETACQRGTPSSASTMRDPEMMPTGAWNALMQSGCKCGGYVNDCFL